MNKKFFGDFNQPGVETRKPQPPLIHKAGPQHNGEQRCTRCGKVLVKSTKGAAATFKEGQDVTVEGSSVTLGALHGAEQCAQAAR